MAPPERSLLARQHNDRPTDIEIALYMVRLMDSLADDLCQKNEGDVLNYYLGMAENVVETMSNTMAKELLKEKVESFKRAAQSP